MMDDERDFDDQMNAYDEIGTKFGQKQDKLSKFSSKFKEIESDPIELYLKHKIRETELSESRRTEKERVIGKWKEFMKSFERHPTCPSPEHVNKFIHQVLSREVQSDYLQNQLTVLSTMFEYWSEHPKMPHGTGDAKGFNPIEVAASLNKEKIEKLTHSEEKLQYNIGIETIGHKIREVKNILHRSILTTQFKYGSRAGQVCNLKIQDVKIDHSELNDLYPGLGSRPALQEIPEDVIYFASRDERPGVKSVRPIVMPIDSETKRILINYLRIRPNVGKDWLFILNSTGNKLRTDYLTENIWKPAFHPEFAGTDQYKPVTSHYARHRFSTYWRKEIGLKREFIKYMRGDNINNPSSAKSDSLDIYVHTYYEDIADRYLSHIYKFGI